MRKLRLLVMATACKLGEKPEVYVAVNDHEAMGVSDPKQADWKNEEEALTSEDAEELMVEAFRAYLADLRRKRK